MPEPERRFTDASGVIWCVREVRLPDRPAALYFETDAAFRRVQHYPRDWRNLPTGELDFLSRGT